MQAQRARLPRPVDRYRDVQAGNVLVTRSADNNIVRLRWPVADVGPKDDPAAPGVDGTPQSISPAAFRIVLALLVVAGACVWVDLLAGRIP